jgi:hypothetical protein
VVLEQVQATVKVSLFKSKSSEQTWLTIPEVALRSPNSDDGTPSARIEIKYKECPSELGERCRGVYTFSPGQGFKSKMELGMIQMPRKWLVKWQESDVITMEQNMKQEIEMQKMISLILKKRKLQSKVTNLWLSNHGLVPLKSLTTTQKSIKTSQTNHIA